MKNSLLLGTLILAPLGAAPWLMGYVGVAYGATAIVGVGLNVRTTKFPRNGRR